MKFTNKDGELRIYDYHSATTGLYLELLFTNADLTFPVARGKVEEMLEMDRGNYNASASYHMGPDDAIFEPLPCSFSIRLEDTTYTGYLRDWLSGATTCNGRTLVTWKGHSTINVGQLSGAAAYSTKSFADNSKMAYRVQVLWDGATDYGWTLDEVYFPPNEQTVTESEDAVTCNINGLIYGNIATMSSFYSGVTCMTAS